MSEKLAWGILSTGRIAKTFAQGVQASRTGKLAAVGSRSQPKAEAFGAEFDIPHRHGSYEALLADPDVQAVYVATPHPMHAEWAIRAAEAGKHVLCEKPLALNHPHAMAIVEAAARNDVFLMEAFMYRASPQTRKLVERVREGAIGEVRLIQASFGFHAAFDPSGRAFANTLGGGGILDVGCYPLSMARLIAGVAQGKDFAEPLSLKAAGHLGQSGVDEWAVALAQFPGGILAQLSTGVSLQLENGVRIFGSEGHIFAPQPWLGGRDGSAVKIFVHKKGARESEEIAVPFERPLYAIEADTVAENIARRQAPSPSMSWDDTLGNMKALDRWRAEIGLLYEAEKPEQNRPIHGRPLAVKTKHSMRYGKIPGLDKKVSRLVMGGDNQPNISHAAVIFDDFFEQGGNAFDTAYIYGGGRQEKLLGQWVRQRGIREEVVILDKGAHTPHCFPEKVSAHLLEGLERLRMDYVDIYMLHRDNLDVPVGEFIGVLNEHQRAGRIKIFGASNWTLARVHEANAFAAEKGLAGFAALSNNFSLARMVEPPWEGCMAASDPAYKAWLTEQQLPLMPWSSQARGFFVRGDPGFRGDAELVRCWYGDDNFERLRRVQEMAQKRGALPIQIALAYVLHQPFPTFPLIGPRVLSETRTSLPALEIELTPGEVKWLNLEA